jgi:putative DNA primase/helicase
MYEFDEKKVHIEVVRRELLEALAAQAPVTPSVSANGTVANGAISRHPSRLVASGNGTGNYESRLIVETWLRDQGIDFRVKAKTDKYGRTVYVLKQCRFDSSHGDPDSCIMQSADGKMSAKCFHNSCAGKGWQDFKKAIGPPEGHHYDPPLRKKGKNKSDSKAIPTVTPPAAGKSCEAYNDPHRLAREHRNAFQFNGIATMYFHRQTYSRWDGTAYRDLNDKEVRAELTESIKHAFDRYNLKQLATWEENGAEGNPPTAPKVTTGAVSNALQALTGMSLLPGTIESPSWIGNCENGWNACDVLACQNALVHLPSFVAGKQPTSILPTPLFYSPNAVDYDFNHQAPKPISWLAFLDQIWHSDPQAIETLQEWFGYCLLPDTSQQKILMLIGPRRAGKGTISRVLSRLLGLHNVTAPTLGSLGLPFGLQPLLNKTLAIITDARLSGRTDTAVVVERLLSISGEDPQTVDRKYLESLTLKLAVRFMILTNELPKLNDPSGALAGRMVLLRLTETFYGREDITLTDTLYEELPGILLWAIEGWKRLRQRGYFQQPDSGTGILQHMEDLASPINAFIRERCETRPGYSVICEQLYDLWKNWCEPKGHKPGTDQTFGRDLRAAVPGLDTNRPRFGAMRCRVYSGIRIRQEADEGEING